MLALGCDDDEGGEEGPAADTEGMQTSSTPPAGTTDADPSTSSTPSGTTAAPEGSTGSDDPQTSGGSTSAGSTGEDDESGETGEDGESGSTGEAAFDEEFIWVADFLRENCVGCHPNDGNGNLVLPTSDIDNDEVRAALEGVEATTGLLLVEPFDRDASQTYLQITNEFGAQFPTEQTDRFGEWIDAGASYMAK